MIEIPPKFAGRAPVGPEDRSELRGVSAMHYREAVVWQKARLAAREVCRLVPRLPRGWSMLNLRRQTNDLAF